MKVYLVVEIELKTNKIDNVGVFSTKEKAQNFISNENKSGDYFEYGITEFLLNGWEVDEEGTCTHPEICSGDLYGSRYCRSCYKEATEGELEKEREERLQNNYGIEVDYRGR